MMQKIQSQLKVSDNLRDKLNEAYDEALKNADFKEVVSKTKLKREILVQYTSTLEECAKEYGNCKKCPGINACKNKITPVFFLAWRIPGTEESVGLQYTGSQRIRHD